MMTTTQCVGPEAAQYEERVARAIAEEDQDHAETLEQARRLIAAGDDPGFSGDLRRAFHSRQMRVDQLADRTGIGWRRICDFLEGAAELTSSEIDKMAKELGLTLSFAIPREPKPQPRRKNAGQPTSEDAEQESSAAG